MLTANCLCVMSIGAAWSAILTPAYAIAWTCTAIGLGLLAWLAEHELCAARGAK